MKGKIFLFFLFTFVIAWLSVALITCTPVEEKYIDTTPPYLEVLEKIPSEVYLSNATLYTNTNNGRYYYKFYQQLSTVFKATDNLSIAKVSIILLNTTNEILVRKTSVDLTQYISLISTNTREYLVEYNGKTNRLTNNPPEVSGSISVIDYSGYSVSEYIGFKIFITQTNVVEVITQ